MKIHSAEYYHIFTTLGWFSRKCILFWLESFGNHLLRVDATHGRSLSPYKFRDKPDSHSHSCANEAHRIRLSAVSFPCHGVELQNANLESALLDCPRLSRSRNMGPPKIPLMTRLNLDFPPENQRLSLVGLQGLKSLVDRLCESGKCSRSLALTFISPSRFG